MESDESPPPDLPAEEEPVSDPELEELLDRSLGEFGKHVQVPKAPSPPPKPKATSTLPPSTEEEFNEVFGEEFAAQAESQLNEALKMMQSESPDLWKQFEEFSKSVGMPAGSASNVEGVASHGESSVDEGDPEEGAREREGSLMGMFEETLQKLKQSTEDIEGSEAGNPFSMDSGDGEDQLLKMMQGMMSSLLSRDVLYPSLMELCKQYPDWLRENEDKISTEDYQRYSKQLEIMTTICREFESQSGEPTEASSERVLSLMQQLQQYGQPPAELATDSEGAGFLPPSGDINPQNCTLM